MGRLLEQPQISVDPECGTRIRHPDYELAVDWLAARDAIRQAEPDHTCGPARVLLVNGSSRTESKTSRLAEIAKAAIETGFPGAGIDVLDLSRRTSEFGKTIHPCKSRVSTSMALCHWPCSCYPNYSFGQSPRLDECDLSPMGPHGIMVITPVIGGTSTRFWLCQLYGQRISL